MFNVILLPVAFIHRIVPGIPDDPVALAVSVTLWDKPCLLQSEFV